MMRFAGLILLASTAPAWADAPVTIDAHAAPSSVIVYPDQAAVTRSSEVEVPAGDSVIVVHGVPVGVLPDSVNASGRATGRVAIGAVETRQASFDAADNASRRGVLAARIQELDQQIARIDVTLASFAADQSLVDRLAAAAAEGRPHGPAGDTDTPARLADDPAAWADARKVVREATAEDGEGTRAAKEERAEAERQRAAAEAELNSLGTHPPGTLDIAVSVTADTATKVALAVTYQVRGAAWRPVYEARLDSGTGKLALREEAAVTQRTGEDWSDVAITLSTARPSAGVQPPPLSPWRISLAEPTPHPAPAPLGMAAPMAAQTSRGLNLAAPQEIARAAATMDATGLAVEYAIPGRSSVASDGSERRVRIADLTADATLAVRAVPRLDTHAYLQARFTSPAPAPMLPGAVSLYVDGAFVGRTQAALVRPGEQTSLPFGADDRVRVSYEPQEQKRSTSGFAVVGNKKVTRAAAGLTVVHNFHDRPIEITVKDQAPVSGDAELVVETTADPAPTARDVENRPGVVAWTATFAPGEERKIHFGWQITSPEGRAVTGLAR